MVADALIFQLEGNNLDKISKILKKGISRNMQSYPIKFSLSRLRPFPNILRLFRIRGFKLLGLRLWGAEKEWQEWKGQPGLCFWQNKSLRRFQKWGVVGNRIGTAEELLLWMMLYLLPKLQCWFNAILTHGPSFRIYGSNPKLEQQQQ